MILKKDTVIKPDIKGIYITVEFDSNGELTNYTEINTHYLKDINVETIKSLIGANRASISGIFKVVLTIKPKYISTCFYKYKSSFHQMIIDCLIDKEYKSFVTFMIVGYIDDVDHFDEFYDCTLCKYFLYFDRCPKIKFREDVDEKEIMMIVDRWLDFYLFDNLIINGKDSFNIIDLSEQHQLLEDKLTWKISQFNTYNLYICENNRLFPIHLPTHYIMNNKNISENTYSAINGKIIASNILNILNTFIDNENLILMDGQLIKKEVK